ncbi:BLUF domain-containing protein [Bradyrhizobium oligotrophicum]|uniref:BLUF domain-containing protein n=1 Tax=Bradyrhizobium oligotrophicum TaxID=44255 RepID=UPI003EB8A20D
MLFRLAYYSTNLIKRSTNPVQSELRKIVLSAGANNRKRGITGGLMFNRDYFGQVLEGDRTSVSDVFCRIAKDTRHRSIVIVDASAVDSRMFEYWSMGLAEKSETAEKLNSSFGLEQGFDPTKMTASDFTSYVFQMVRLEDRLVSVTIPNL